MSWEYSRYHARCDKMREGATVVVQRTRRVAGRCCNADRRRAAMHLGERGSGRLRREWYKRDTIRRCAKALQNDLLSRSSGPNGESLPHSRQGPTCEWESVEVDPTLF